MKHLLKQFPQAWNSHLYLRSPEGVETPLETSAVNRGPNPQEAAAALGAHGVDLTQAVNRLPGAEELSPIVNDIENRLNQVGQSPNIGQTLDAFGQTDFMNADNPNLFSMFKALLEEMGVDLDNLDQDPTTGASGGGGGGSAARRPREGGPMAEVPPNEEMPELDETPSSEDMAMLRSRAGSADVDNMTNPAKNIAIETLRAHPNLTVTSGFRDPERNRRAGGVPGSDHTTGNAIDFGTIDASVQRWVEAAFPGQVFALIHGNTRNPDPTHLHVSYRPGGNQIA